MDLTLEQLAFCVKRHVLIDFVDDRGTVYARAMYELSGKEYGVTVPMCKEMGEYVPVSELVRRLMEFDSLASSITL